MNLHDKAGLFGRFNAAWTPTILVMSPKGVERYRIEGYLPRNLFRAELEMGLARVQFMAKRFAEADQMYGRIIDEHPGRADEAMYWRAVCRYNATHDPSPLMQVAQDLQRLHPDSIWTVKASVWAPADTPAAKASVH